MMIGPEDPRPFVELASWLGQDRLPWRCSFILEGGGKTGMAFKEIGSSFLSIFPANRDLQRAFASLRNLATGETYLREAARLLCDLGAPWRDAQAPAPGLHAGAKDRGMGQLQDCRVAGDPLDGVMSYVPGLALASTGNPLLAPIGEALLLLPWSHTISPWERGIRAVPPAERSNLALRSMRRLDAAAGDRLLVAPPGSGKSVLANSIESRFCLSSAVLGSDKAKLPLIGKLDIGSSAEGFVRLI